MSSAAALTSGPTFRLIGRGVYSLREARRLTGVPMRRLRRWTLGYEFTSTTGRRHSPPVIDSDLTGELGLPALDFADLLEVRFLNAFREYGVSMRAIRLASQAARELLGVQRPFSSRTFSTDGRVIMARLASTTDDDLLIDLVHRQYEFDQVVSQYLRGDVEFGDGDRPSRWWPLEGSRRVVIDPQRALGAPIIDVAGIPTRVIAQAFQAEGAADVVSALYGVDDAAVMDAVRYELALAVA